MLPVYVAPVQLLRALDEQQGIVQFTGWHTAVHSCAQTTFSLIVHVQLGTSARAAETKEIRNSARIAVLLSNSSVSLVYTLVEYGKSQL